MKQIKRYIIIGILFFMIVMMNPAFCTIHNTGWWNAATIVGTVPQHEKLKYYLEPQIFFIDNAYKISQLYFFSGLGYEFNQNLFIFAGPGWILNKNLQGQYVHEYLLWQQINWQVWSDTWMLLNSRTRLEERKNTQFSQLSVRLRERLWLRIPINAWPSWSFSFFNEIFFNINQPKWVVPYFLDQNRVFIGLGKEISQSTILDMGYLNQYIFSTPSHSTNVLFVNFTVVF